VRFGGGIPPWFTNPRFTFLVKHRCGAVYKWPALNFSKCPPAPSKRRQTTTVEAAEIDRLMAEMQLAREFLQSEGERVEQETVPLWEPRSGGFSHVQNHP
jgi:hypothetical protein